MGVVEELSTVFGDYLLKCCIPQDIHRNTTGMTSRTNAGYLSRIFCAPSSADLIQPWDIISYMKAKSGKFKNSRTNGKNSSNTSTGKTIYSCSCMQICR